MARQSVDIGVQGNDGTGDSIRESFRKVNENFREIYALVGGGDTIAFTDLDDTPNSLGSNKVPVSNDAGTALLMKSITGTGGILIDNTSETELVIRNNSSNLSSDDAPQLGNPLDARNYTIGRLPDPSPTVLSAFNAIHGPNGITTTIDRLAIPKGYADTTYVAKTGGVMSGALEVPAGASGNQVARAGEVVLKAGSTMTGTLLLDDHPGPLAGQGTPNGPDDLQAATKYYVDNSSFASSVNLFVATSGDDAQTNTPPGKEGRAFAYAYATISAACLKAEELIDASQYEPGPYRQKISWTSGLSQTFSTIQTVAYSGGNSGNSNYLNTQTLLNANMNFIKQEVIGYINATFPSFVGSYNETTCKRDIGLIIDAIIIDILVDGNYQSVNAGKAYYRNASGRLAIGSQGTETLAGINHAKTIIPYILDSVNVPTSYQTTYTQFKNLSLTVNSAAKSEVASRFTIITNIIDNGLGSAPTIDYGTGYVTITVDNGGNGNVDQGDPTNQDLITGKVVRGLTSASTARILSYSPGATVDTITLNLLKPFTLSVGEELEFSEIVKELNITVRVETGIYYDDYPIRVPANVSIKGDEFRRVIIRPRDRVSQSPWVRTYFFRDTTIDGLTITSTNYGYHYLSNPALSSSTPKNNKDLDVFLMNDATILRNITGQGHGGFMMVLDPEGQILSKSPYAQTCTSLSQSINKQAFRGGQFIDGFAGRLPATISSVAVGNLELTLTGLTIRAPQTPTSFVYAGIRYKVNVVKSYSGSTAVVELAASTPWSGGSPIAITLETPGNRSMLSNDFTQVNDLAYGIVAHNTGTTEQVSTFTYYCYTAYWANNGGQIRALNGSNANGVYGLRATGSDPNEVPDTITLNDNLVQTAKIYKTGTLASTGGITDLTLYIQDYDYPPYNVSELEIDHGGSVGFVRYEISNTERTDIVTSASAPANISGATNANPVVVTTIGSHGLSSYDYVTITGVAGMNINSSYYVRSTGSNTFALYSNPFFNNSTGTGATVNGTGLGTYSSGGSVTGGQRVLKVNLSTSGTSGTSTSGLQDDLSNSQKISIRVLQNFRFKDVLEVNPTRPSTALKFAESASTVYRAIAYAQEGPGGGTLPTDSAVLTVDQSFDYIQISVDPTAVTTTDPGNPAKTLGSLAGDNKIAVTTITDVNDLARITAGGKIFAWDGKIHIITSYTPAAGLTPPYITVSDGRDINLPSISGINSGFSTVDSFSIRAGLQSGESGTVTVRISTCRATGHDFLDIGTGGYNTSNYPTSIYGSPAVSKVQSQEVVEETTGRVFYVTTDQDGIFRVGRYFTVDQGTGTVTFSASIALSNLSGFGFKRGVQVSEFSTDATMTDNAVDTVPTESAVRGYIDKRLGLDHIGTALPAPNLIGPGFMPRNGALAATGDQNFGGFKLTNVGTPTTASDGANKSYVDGQIALKDQLSELGDVTISSLAPGHILKYNSGTGKWFNGLVEVADATAAATAGAATKGIASFDSANFETNAAGWVSIKNSGVAAIEMANIDNGSILGNFTGSATYPREVTAGTVVTQGDGIKNASFAAAGIMVVSSIGPNTYTTTPVTTSGSADSIVKTDSSGNIDANGFKIQTASILERSGANLRIKTPGGVTFIQASGSATASVTMTGDFTLASGSTMQATYADLAEYYEGDQDYEVGTVLIFGGDKEVTGSTVFSDSRVAGVVSNNAAYIMNNKCPGNKVLIALQGRVPVKVTGRVKKGDLLTTAGVPGYAAKAVNPQVGTIIGKSLVDKDYTEAGVIEVAVGRV